MTWSSTGTQSGTDTSLSTITSVTGVTVNVSANGHRTYQVPTSITLLTITGTLSWDSDYETLELSESTRVEQNSATTVTIGKSTTINGKTRWSAGVGLIMNRQQGSPFINTSSCNWWLKAGTTLANSGKFIVNGCRVMSGGGIFCGNDTSPTGDYVTFELNGGAVLQNISTSQNMQMVRCFCEPSGININQGTIDGRTIGGIPFSNAGWGTLNLSLAFGNFQCDGNGAAAPVTVANATLAANVNVHDYSYVANANDKTKINKYIFKNSDVGSTLRTLGQTGTAWRLGVVEITKDVVFSVADSSSTAIENAVTYMKLLGASINPSTGSRYAGIDDYMTPRVYIAGTASTGLTTSANILYAVAQGYATDATGAGTALTMDSLTTRTSDVTDGYIWSYSHLVGQPTAAMRGNNTLTQSWTLFNDSNVTLSRTAAIAKLASSFTVNPTTMTVTVTGNSTYDDLYDALKAYKCSTTQAQIEAPVIGQTIVTASGANLTAYTGWTLVVNSGVTLAEGTKFTYVYFDTVTINGSITGIYASTAGTSTTFRFSGIQVGSSIVVYDSSGVTKYFQGSVTSSGDYNYYIPPGTTGTYSWAIEKYGKQRESGTFAANTGGLLFYAPLYVEDVGITQTTLATVNAYTEIETASKFYDRTAAFRMTEQGIKLGQIATRSGTSIEIGSFSHVINKDSASVYSVTGSTITTKSTSYPRDSKYSTEIATPPATISANTTEVITIAIEDANGNSQVTINGGDGTFELWKVTTATATNDYATGTLLDTVGNETYRFTGVSGYDIVGVDINSNIRRRTSMAKGIYTQAFYVGDQIQLAQAPQVDEILTKVEILEIDMDDIKGTGFTKDKHSLTNIKKKAALAAALSA